MNPFKNIFLFLLMLVHLGLAQIARAAEAEVWQLLPSAQVDSSGIFLNQLVFPPATSVVPLPQIRLASAPNLGQTTSFSRDQITELVRKHSPELITSNWSGATQVRVSRRTRQFIDSEMTELLTATLQREFIKDRGELEIHLTRPWAAIPVPDEPLSLKVFDLPASGINPNCVIHGELGNGKERVGDWQLTLQASVWREIPVAHTTLTRGQLLRDADVTMERRDVLVLRDAYLNFSHADDTLQLAENIPAGLPVLNRSVRIRPVIQRGQLVEGIYQDGSLSISLKVETLEDGLPGQTVRVRNPKTKRELYGKVQNEQTVLIAL
jgi:flagella basal body P-ring formation protein FlgA